MTGGKRIIRIIILAIVLILYLLATIYATNWVLTLRNPDKLAAFQDLIDTLGTMGFFALLAIQYIQIVVAFIPGGPIQIASGALYGPLGGLLICLIGTILASSTVFYLVRRFGHSVISLFVDSNDITQYNFLADSKRLNMLIVILFFIPGTPKDALTYLFALTAIPMPRFIALATVARLPAMITSTFAGDRIINGEWLQAGFMFLAITVIGLAGFALRRRILRHYSKKN